MRVAESTGKTVEEAIEASLLELGVERRFVNTEVLEEPTKKGLFGFFGTRQARVRVSYEDDPGVLAEDFINQLCEAMKVIASTKVSKEESYWRVDITGPDLGILIGRRGDTLEALQYLTNLAVTKRLPERTRIIVDVEGYRLRREETLIRLAKRLSEKVKRTGSRIVLEPMNPYERRIIHTSLQNEDRIMTISEGAEPNRRVIISSKKSAR